jgi:hypothetical protein
MPSSKRLAAEFIGTLWLVLGGLRERGVSGGLSQCRHRPARSFSRLWFDCPNYGVRRRSYLRLPSQPGGFLRLVGG